MYEKSYRQILIGPLIVNYDHFKISKAFKYQFVNEKTGKYRIKFNNKYSFMREREKELLRFNLFFYVTAKAILKRRRYLK